MPKRIGFAFCPRASFSGAMGFVEDSGVPRSLANRVAPRCRGVVVGAMFALMAAFPTTFRTALLQEDQSSADTAQVGIRRRPAPIP